MLTIINPTPRKTGAKRKGPKMATKRKKGMPAGLKRYWAKVRAGKRHRNPSTTSTKRRRRVHRNPVMARARRRVHRNPSQMFTSKGIFGELMTAEGLMMVAAVALTPTVTSLAINQFGKTLTGYQRAAAKAAVGLGLGFGVYQFINKKAGLVAAVAALGIAAAECYNYATKHTPVSGYMAPSMNYGNLHVYAASMQDGMSDMSDIDGDMNDGMSDLGYNFEPGVRYV